MAWFLLGGRIGKPSFEPLEESRRLERSKARNETVGGELDDLAKSQAAKKHAHDKGGAGKPSR
jgi:hypothetical protein